jgi:salicylate hydroxylase
VTLADGTVDSGDLVIAANGVHSKATRVVIGEDLQPHSTKQSCFRFLVSSSELKADPTTASFLENDDGRCKIYLADNGNRVAWYPCRNNEEHNIAAIIHETVSETEREGKHS